MILIYSDTITPRLEYTVHLIFREILGTEFRVIRNSSELKQGNHPVLNYSKTTLPGTLQIVPHPLLFQSDIRPQEVTHVIYRNEVCFFKTQGENSLPFDPLAATFYLVTRYEEYLVSERDRFNRYCPENSILWKFDLLKKPVVNIWARMLATELMNRYPQLHIPVSGFEAKIR